MYIYKKVYVLYFLNCFSCGWIFILVPLFIFCVKINFGSNCKCLKCHCFCTSPLFCSSQFSCMFLMWMLSLYLFWGSVWANRTVFIISSFLSFNSKPKSLFSLHASLNQIVSFRLLLFLWNCYFFILSFTVSMFILAWTCITFNEVFCTTVCR